MIPTTWDVTPCSHRLRVASCILSAGTVRSDALVIVRTRWYAGMLSQAISRTGAGMYGLGIQKHTVCILPSQLLGDCQWTRQEHVHPANACLARRLTSIHCFSWSKCKLCIPFTVQPPYQAAILYITQHRAISTTCTVPAIKGFQAASISLPAVVCAVLTQCLAAISFSSAILYSPTSSW